jgi:hypothetical protein
MAVEEPMLPGAAVSATADVQALPIHIDHVSHCWSRRLDGLNSRLLEKRYPMEVPLYEIG